MHFGRGHTKPPPGKRLALGHPHALDCGLYLPLNEGSGTYCNDVSGHRGGVITDGSWGGSTEGRVLSLGGAGSINCGDVAALNSVTSFTLELWFRQPVLDVADWLWYKHLSSNYRVAVDTALSGNLTCHVANGAGSYGYFDYSTAVSANQWAHLVVVYDGFGSGNAGRLKCYVDGQEQTLTFVKTIPASTADLAGYDLQIGIGFAGDILLARVFKYPMAVNTIRKLRAERYGAMR